MKSKILAIGFGVVALITFSGCSLFYPNAAPTPTQTQTPTDEPTETPTPTPTPTDDPELKTIKLNVLDATAFRDNGTVTVIAEALGVLEEGGKCTLKVTQGKVSKAVTVASEPNVTSTQCFPMEVPIDDFKIGKLDFSVSYTSSKSKGFLESSSLSVE